MQYQKPVLVQEQKLSLSPQLIQSINMMALPLQELRHTIMEELEKNPALDVESDASEVSLNTLDSSGDEYDFFENSSDPGYIKTKNNSESDSKSNVLEGTVSRGESLQDHLLEQWHLQPLSPQDIYLGELIIQNLDHKGFHQENPESLVTTNDEKKKLSLIISLIQQLDPQGCAVFSSQESLKAQISINPHISPQAILLIDTYADLTAKGDLKGLSKKMNLSEDEISLLLADIKSLNPHPGTLFSMEEPHYIIPEMSIFFQNDEIFVSLQDGGVPVLRINPDYQELEKECDNNEVKRFTKEHIQSGLSFINSIQHRNQTLLKVGRALAEHQAPFFKKGPKALLPLTMKEVAESIEMSEGTVSRISSSKYIQTEWGILPIKYFFSNSISGTGSQGSQYSHNAVKEYVKEIITNANPEKHLSDQKISDILKEKGIRIARRTVSKYRRELNIESSYNR